MDRHWLARRWEGGKGGGMVGSQRTVRRRYRSRWNGQAPASGCMVPREDRRRRARSERARGGERRAHAWRLLCARVAWK